MIKMADISYHVNPEHGYISRCEAAFEDHFNRGTFKGHIGEWTLFGGEEPKDPVGFYQTQQDALREGYSKFGPDANMLVRQVTVEERVDTYTKIQIESCS